MSLKQSMKLAGDNLLHCLCPTRNYLPYWCLEVDQDYRGEFLFQWPAHNIGRWWDALLRLENAIEFCIPAHLEGAMLENLYRFFHNSDNLCFAPFDLEGVEPFFELHSLRESLLALTALVRYRKNHWAKEQGHRMLETIFRVSRVDGGWDLNKIDYYHRAEKKLTRFTDPTGSNGRLIEALVWFYEATGDPLALQLADRFARYHFANTTDPGGELNTTSQPDHTHSYFGTLRGLLLFGLLTHQHQYVDRVAITYQVTVRRLVKESGFTAHDLGEDTRGETTSSGDAAQLALWLALCGHYEFLDDAERIVRARLLPSQIIESPGIYPVANDGKDEHSNLDIRVVGGFGGMHTEPHAGKKNVTDITAANVHTLTDIYNHIAIPGNEGLIVYFHFDYEDKNVQIITERSQEAKVTIIPKTNSNLFIRIPQWAPPESIHLRIGERRVEPVMLGNFAYLPENVLSKTITLQYGLPIRTCVEETDGVKYKLTWRGDEIIGVYPNSDFLSFYPNSEGCA